MTVFLIVGFNSTLISRLSSLSEIGRFRILLAMSPGHGYPALYTLVSTLHLALIFQYTTVCLSFRSPICCFISLSFHLLVLTLTTQSPNLSNRPSTNHLSPLPYFPTYAPVSVLILYSVFRFPLDHRSAARLSYTIHQIVITPQPSESCWSSFVISLFFH